jgi:hypothetical protein
MGVDRHHGGRALSPSAIQPAGVRGRSPCILASLGLAGLPQIVRLRASEICYDQPHRDIVIMLRREFVLSSIWEFLKDGSNQAVLTWIGGGIAAVAAGIWAVVKLMAKKGSVSADHGSAASGHDINAPININSPGTSERTAKNGDQKLSKPRGSSKR